MNLNLILGAAAILYGLYTAYLRATVSAGSERSATGIGSPLQLGAPRVEPDAVNLESDAVTLGA